MDYIKFRVFYKEQMIPCEVTMDGYIHIYNEKKKEFEVVGCIDQNRVLKQKHVMQFICMFDKNDKPIYEGDIVKLQIPHYFWGKWKSYTKYIQGVIVFRNTSFMLVTDKGLHQLSPEKEKLEVVGNIYESRILRL